MVRTFERLPQRCGRCHAVLFCVTHMIAHVTAPHMDGDCRCSCVCVRLGLREPRLPPKRAARRERRTIRKAG